MSESNLRVYPVKGDGYGEPTEYPQYAGYRFEPHEPGRVGDSNHDLVVYLKARPEVGQEEEELGRHNVTDVLIVFPGQPSPVSPDMVAAPASKKSKAGSPVDK